MADALPTKLTLTVVSRERKIVEIDVDEVVLPASDGEIGVLPGHTPLLTTLRVGTLRYRAGSTVEKLATLKPVFRPDGEVTAGNACPLNDGAAAVVVMSDTKAKELGITPLARIVGHATHSQEPEWFTTAPVVAMDKLLKKIGWKVDDVDLFEVNEAFAVVAMAPMKELGVPHAKLNINGGATALGHPIGASGARLIVTLINALRKTGGKRGVASLCIGGGEATAIAIELA